MHKLSRLFRQAFPALQGMWFTSFSRAEPVCIYANEYETRSDGSVIMWICKNGVPLHCGVHPYIMDYIEMEFSGVTYENEDTIDC